jgi:signal transduction histidine kinase/CheY-like chemotaxis protein
VEVLPHPAPDLTAPVRPAGRREPLVGLVARVVPLKDVAGFVLACAGVAAAHPTCRFVVLGPLDADVGYAAECQLLAEAVGLGDRLTFTGETDVGQWWPELSVLVSTSRSEARPFVLLEAMQHGVPVVATAVGDCADMLLGGRLPAAGVVVPPGDVGAVVHAVCALLSAPRRASVLATQDARAWLLPVRDRTCRPLPRHLREGVDGRGTVSRDDVMTSAAQPATVAVQLHRATRASLVGVVTVVLIGVLALLLILTLIRPPLQTQARAGRMMRITSRDMLNMQTGVRGFLLTDDPMFLEPYVASRAALPEDQATLRRLLGGGAETTNELEAMITSQEEWLAHVEDATVDRPDAVEPFIRESKRLFDDFRARSGRLENRVDENRRRLENQQYGMLVGALVAQVAVGAGAFAVTARSGRRLQQSVSDPVRRLYADVVRFRSGETDIDATVGGPLEVQELAVALNETAAVVLAQRAAEEAHRRDLEAAKVEADRANAAKSAFLSTMSHEIRTPLNGVIGMAGMLLETPLGEAQREYAEIIRNNGDLLLTVINDVLDFSKIEAGRLDLESQPFDVRDCVESALDTIAPQAAGKDLDLVYFAEPDSVVDVVGDVTRLRQVLVNLLGNAIKFTQHGEVVVTVSTAAVEGGEGDVELRVAVRDTGLGIAADRLDQLFQPFTQADASTTREYGGTGLGLAISRRLAEAMGGGLWAESEPGVGSTFHVTARLGRAAEPVRTRRHEHAGALRGRRVLIVDDNDTNRRVLCHHLTGWGMEVQDRGEAVEALAGVQSGERYDLFILDMHMPGMDGSMLCRELRTVAGAGATPVVLLSSLGRREPDDADGACFDAQLTKPVKPGHLYDVLNRVVRGAPDPGTGRPAADRPSPQETVALEVLVVDDNSVNRRVAVALLDRLGHRASLATNGREAVEAVGSKHYDVVLMDVYMPEVDGLEATRRIRAELPAAMQPVIVALSAGAFAEERERCRAAGMDHFVAKPVRVEDLSVVLQGVSPRTSIEAAEADRVAPGAPDGGRSTRQCSTSSARRSAPTPTRSSQISSPTWSSSRRSWSPRCRSR